MHLWIIARATCTEAVRSRAFLGLLGIHLVAVLASRIVGWVSSTDGHVVTTDLVMSLQSVIGVLVAVATGTALVHSEITNRTLYTVLVRPMPRWQFVVGKFTGLALALVIGQLAMATTGGLYLWITGATLNGWLAFAALLTAVEVLVMAAVGLCLTALTSPLLAAVLSLVVFACGHAVASLPELINHLKGWQVPLAASLASAIPNLGMFTYRNQAVHGLPIGAGDLLLRLGYGAAWIILLVTVTVGLFRRKQL